MQTSNSIMRQEIKQKRIEDNLDAYAKSSKFFEALNNEIEAKSRRRYLENCIELAGKVHKSNGINKEQQLKYVSEMYKENYNNYIEFIKKLTIDKNEQEIIAILEQAYEVMNNQIILGSEGWEKLEKLINKG